jgi:hypothetical protein
MVIAMTKRPDTTPPAIREALQDTATMDRFMDALVGKGNWTYDAADDVWITPNDKGPGFYVVKRGGDWFVATPEAAS